MNILPAIIDWHSAHVSACVGRKIARTERQTVATATAGCLKPLEKENKQRVLATSREATAEAPELGTWARNLNLGREPGTWTWDVSQEPELGTWARNLNLGCEPGAWTWDVSQEPELGMWARNLNLGCEPGTWTWDVSQEPELGTWASDLVVCGCRWTGVSPLPKFTSRHSHSSSRLKLRSRAQIPCSGYMLTPRVHVPS
jgi:hypothetical protein